MRVKPDVSECDIMGTNENQMTAIEELQNRFLEAVLWPEIRTTNPYYWHLVKIKWAVIGTLTWKNEWSRACCHWGNRKRQKDFNRLIRIACSPLGLNRERIAFYFKNEFGAGEGHAHFLIAQKGTETISPEVLAATLTTIWTTETNFREKKQSVMGTAYIKPFDVTRLHEGVSYTCKREWDVRSGEIDTSDLVSKGLKKLILGQGTSASPTIDTRTELTNLSADGPSTVAATANNDT